ncbi:F0F1 ATP synthase subunit gamma [Devosia sp. J2-20]|uniref:F0F1 ATP synthase subunit gamma n=1 Tax=Devosia sp. J2-20 TaxID=3026161 RepID=UPI00249A0519|nr:F0F1 ATP synthase subunit gamma [Devosia sp. J2-20]WDQ98585.1 F0F1 ATP synthase subunit gamma [Devosia sp. J2-20]
MSSTIAGLRRTIDSAQDLHAVVRTMKALAASSIIEYEQSVHALDDYYRTVQLGLGVCIRNGGDAVLPLKHHQGVAAVVVFGSDQGLVGRFNDVVAHQAISSFGNSPHTRFWAVGERASEPLKDAGLTVDRLFGVPVSVSAIGLLVTEILGHYEAAFSRGEINQLHVAYNKAGSGVAFAPLAEKVLPLDENWRKTVSACPWPSGTLPEEIGTGPATLSAFVREFLFVSLFRACAASLASENASRLAAMQRADKNIDSLLGELTSQFHRMRQDGIDEELFDVVAGYEALNES